MQENEKGSVRKGKKNSQLGKYGSPQPSGPGTNVPAQVKSFPDALQTCNDSS